MYIYILLAPSVEYTQHLTNNFDFKIRRDHQKNIL